MNKFIYPFILFTVCFQAAHAQVKPGKNLVKAARKVPVTAAQAAQKAATVSTIAITRAAAAGRIAFAADAATGIHPLPFESGSNNQLPNETDNFYISPQSVILDEYDKRFSLFEYNVKAEEAFSPEKIAYAKQARAALQADLPQPTDAQKLTRYYRLPDNMVEQYQHIYSRATEMQPYLRGQLLPLLQPAAPKRNPQEVREIDDQLSRLADEISQITKHMFNIDPFLAGVIDRINWSREILFDIPGQLVKSNLARPYAFSPDAHRLISPLGAAPRLAIRNDDFFFSKEKALQAAHELSAQIPAGLRIAFLNDRDDFREPYLIWQNIGAFANGITVEVFDSVNGFMQAHAQQPFDFVLTDYFIPGGGGNFLVKTLRDRQDDTPVILQSYSGEGTTAWQKTRDENLLEKDYQQGYDGFLPTNDDFFSSRGYLYVLEGIRNFYLYHGAKGL